MKKGKLFCKSRTTILGYIKNIFDEGELVEDNTKRKVGISDFSTKPTSIYNIDAIIAIGFHVRSKQGTLFLIWTAQL
ncbi:MAG: virulence RhuM family protein [Prevotellaceae bacterium]|nr:virulence RhuM family protein [Candidatus Colivivens equi]